ncbi:unnamed protein product [Hymenolepis diminuta]|uniref:Uncharacterized protein n=1 Tax=Hymenolepis diminuta TaxID=6216 RepID=A0A0R3SFU3_HYMDI|nr:unnamed protein product [Hymenolepis diminuta]
MIDASNCSYHWQFCKGFTIHHRMRMVSQWETWNNFLRRFLPSRSQQGPSESVGRPLCVIVGDVGARGRDQ